MDNKFLTTIVLAAAAGVAGALLYNRFLKKPCKCKDNTEPPILGKGTIMAPLDQNASTLNYIGKVKKHNWYGPASATTSGWENFGNSISEALGWGRGSRPGFSVALGRALYNR